MRRFFLRLLNVFRRKAAEVDLSREIAAHLAILEDEFRRRGMSAGAARLAATRALGSVAHTQDLHRDARSFPWLTDLRNDTRYGWRTIARDPGFTSVALITLALGIGANTAIFSVINAVLLNPLPFKSGDRLVRLVEHVPAAASPTGRAFVQGSINLEELIELRTRSRPFSHMVTYSTDIVTLVGASSDGSLAGTAVSAGTFPMLGVQPILGRTFLPEEEAPDGPQATLYNVATMGQIVGNSMVRPRLYAMLLAIFAAVAVVLAAIGIFGVMAYTVAQRTREIGIRMALGARHAQVLRLVLGRSLALTVIGIALGLTGAAALTRYLEGLLFGLTPLDPSTFIAVSALFTVIATIASWVPARRATKVDPLIALRYE